jgi:hypothetical protein
MGRSVGASFEIATGNLVEVSSAVRIEIFNGVKRPLFGVFYYTDRKEK